MYTVKPVAAVTLYTVKPVAELNLMTDQEIRLDAWRACGQSSIEYTHDDISDIVEAEEYLQLLGRVARQRNNGVEPPWVQQAAQAAQQRDDGKSCSKLFAADLAAQKQKPAQHQKTTP